jgi:DNA-binding winged helix-turn-helix (wHTH) protein
MSDPVGYLQPSARHRYQAGKVEIRPDTNTVVVSGEGRFLRQQAMAVLVHLLQRPGQVVPEDVLTREFWKDPAVADDTLVQCIAEIRKALADDPRRPRFLLTAPEGGYCFIAPVNAFLEMPSPSRTTEGRTDRPRPARPWRAWLKRITGG